MAKADLSADEARTFISYDQATGAFHWAADLGARAKAGSRAGSKERQGYIAITIRGETYKAHRLAWLLADGGGGEHQNSSSVPHAALRVA